MLLENINFLLSERGEAPLSAKEFFALKPFEVWSLIQPLGVPFEQLNTLDISKSRYAKKRHQLKLVVLDVDGVFTDGGMYYTSSGEEMKKFNVKDGMAIVKAIKAGMIFGIISAASRSEVVKTRASILGIQRVYVGTQPKIEVLNSWLKELGIDFENVAYIGDDVNDVAILEKVGLSAAPSDAVLKARSAASVVLNAGGGQGCIREFIEGYIQEVR